jgi:hypothetical protein
LSVVTTGIACSRHTHCPGARLSTKQVRELRDVEGDAPGFGLGNGPVAVCIRLGLAPVKVHDQVSVIVYNGITAYR